MEQKGWQLGIKKAIDRSVAAVGLVIGAPLLIGAAIAVKTTMGSPVLFRQTRPGHKTKLFVMPKFRTMTDARGPDGQLLPDAARLTPVGRFLRRTSIDELPQLFSVLKGDLSLVGPRPLLVEYLDRYTSEQMRRHDVLPGMTGMTAVSGRHALDWEERFRLDLWYVDRWSLWLDFKILVKTAYKVIARDGISIEGDVTPWWPSNHRR